MFSFKKGALMLLSLFAVAGVNAVAFDSSDTQDYSGKCCHDKCHDKCHSCCR